MSHIWCCEPCFPAPYSENCPPTEKAALPKKGFSGDLNLNSILEADKLGRPSHPFTSLWGAPHPLLCPSLLFPSVAGWKSKAGPDRVIYILMTGLERTECWNFRQPPVVLEILSFDTRLT